MILLLQKDVYPYEYMDDWEKFNKTLLPEKEDITDADYAHAKRVYKDFEIKYSGEYHALYVQSHPLLLADVFENFKNICVKNANLIQQNFFQLLN